MIKYPDVDIAKKSLQHLINCGGICIGERVFLENNPVTCVHIDGDRYIFSMDDIFKIGEYDQIEQVLKTIYTTGTIDGISVIPANVIKDIDFLFIPTEKQVFGNNNNGVIEEDDKQFEWFKRGDAARIKGYFGTDRNHWDYGETCSWWLSTSSFDDGNNYCSVDYLGRDIISTMNNCEIGIPIFFQMTRNN